MQDIDSTALKGKIFRHFKGDLYLLIDIAENTETREKMVYTRRCMEIVGYMQDLLICF